MQRKHADMHSLHMQWPKAVKAALITRGVGGQLPFSMCAV